MSYDVVGIGNPLLDATANVEYEFLKSHSLMKGEMHLVDTKTSGTLLEQLQSKIIDSSAGGSVANTLAMVANLGGSSLLLGLIGSDTYGDIYEQSTTQIGITSGLARTEQNPQGTCLVLITPDGERTMITHLGASIHFTKDHVDTDAIRNAKVLHLEGYQLDSNNQVEAIIHAMNIAKDNNVRISMDLSDPALIRRHKELILRLVKDYVDIVFTNASEAEELTGKIPHEAIEEIHKISKIAVVKLGEQGSLVKDGFGIHKIDAHKVNVENTNGAGDAYAGGFLYGLAQGKSSKESAKIASFVASKVVASVGGRVDESLLEEIKNIK